MGLGHNLLLAIKIEPTCIFLQSFWQFCVQFWVVAEQIKFLQEPPLHVCSHIWEWHSMSQLPFWQFCSHSLVIVVLGLPHFKPQPLLRQVWLHDSEELQSRLSHLFSSQICVDLFPLARRLHPPFSQFWTHLSALQVSCLQSRRHAWEQSFDPVQSIAVQLPGRHRWTHLSELQLKAGQAFTTHTWSHDLKLPSQVRLHCPFKHTWELVPFSFSMQKSTARHAGSTAKHNTVITRRPMDVTVGTKGKKVSTVEDGYVLKIWCRNPNFQI